VYDPEAALDAGPTMSDNIEFCNTALDAISGSDCILITTDWDEFKDESLYKGKLVIDGRRTLNPQKARNLCRYEGICW
jgi:UDP-glucose 6-dehydrogenase